MLSCLVVQDCAGFILEYRYEPYNVAEWRAEGGGNRAGKSVQFLIRFLQECGAVLQISIEPPDFLFSPPSLDNLVHKLLIDLRELCRPLGHTLLQLKGQDHDFVIGGGEFSLQQPDHRLWILRTKAHACQHVMSIVGEHSHLNPSRLPP